jgi:hypothetical protein
MGWTIGIRGFDSRQGAGNFSVLHFVQTGSGAHPAFYPMGTGALSPEVKRPRRETGHSPLSKAEVQPQYFISWCLVKYMDNLTLFFTFCL